MDASGLAAEAALKIEGIRAAGVVGCEKPMPEQHALKMLLNGS